MERYVCIHGHFYQPPRENAWLEYVEWQDAAYPYHDWNEKIAAECYMTNASSHLLDKDGLIDRVVNNYSSISFDFGPTLLAWMETGDRDTYRAIIEADRQSRDHFSGHGSAIAQAYNHVIMPLANHRDRYTQVRWGIRDFEHRFGRKPEGMWLPETAVDLETLDIMASLGIKFTILSPRQARRFRPAGSSNWKNVSDGTVDPTCAYAVNLPSGRKLAVFFFDSPISNAVAFEDILKSGEAFANRLVSAFSEKRRWPQLVNIATDGETYGHHHRFADMALAFAIRYIESNGLARITNYGEYLEKYPPAHEVEIIEKSSWSCKHGIDRWWSDCGDTAGDGEHPGWNQQWRTPLRNAFDYLRDTLATKYEEKARLFLKHPWAARDDYIDVIIDRSPESVARFFNRHAGRKLDETEKVTVLKLLELQRHAMLMYTSCGWFFDEISRPEPVQVLQYAGRVAQLAGELFEGDVEENFLKTLEEAKSNIPEQENGRRIYENLVRPAMVDLKKVAAHAAVNSLSKKSGEENRAYCYGIEMEDAAITECGEARLVTGRCRVTSQITGESDTFIYGALRREGYVVNAGVSKYDEEEIYRNMARETTLSCSRGDYSEVVRLLEKHLGSSHYSLTSLFRDEQRKVLGEMLESTMSAVAAAYRGLYEHYYPPARFLSELGGPVPRNFHAAAELIINSDLHRAVNAARVDATAVKTLLETAKIWSVDIDAGGISYDLKKNIEKMMAGLASSPGDLNGLQALVDVTSLARGLPFPVDLWKVQGFYRNRLQTDYPDYKRRAEAGDAPARHWLEAFALLGKELNVRMEKQG